ncbi:hypothetical protein BIW11_00138 [Tropilaelaps mercedesae]|uniref:Uncharacterized protein n=1 Tax=Tropilaelaps mercedesae TaxID=418985 RepID=A0A1V9Y1E2_9ACAR|nr:hypothetical protein BIW11_00138 [Tropilaelaps mercedesae]
MDLSCWTLKLKKASSDADKLKADVQRIREERDALQVAYEQVKTCVRELEVLKEREAAFKLLQKDQASQIEVFKEEWRKEETARMKWENDYKELLQTWQNVEQNLPVIVSGETSQRTQIDIPRQHIHPRPAADLYCPLCNDVFSDQETLIRHADLCEGTQS